MVAWNARVRFMPQYNQKSMNGGRLPRERNFIAVPVPHRHRDRM
jgi:hypothetical protein